MPNACFVMMSLIVVLATTAAPRSQGPPQVRYGVAAFGNVDPLQEVEMLAAAGYDYIEPALSRTVALSPDALADARRRVQASGIRVETMNWFLPGSEIPLTGPAVERRQIEEYLERSLGLAESFGAKVIVFGSPGARSVPDGFPREKAWEQLKDFLRLCAEVIERNRYGMVIGLEPLRKPETNIINSVPEGIRMVREVNHPTIRLTVDFYHVAYENEDPAVVLEAGDLIAHTQIADPKTRLFPVADAGEPRYGQYFENLRKIGYSGRISVEANAENLPQDAPAALAFLKRLSERHGRASP
jgi:D-psicose/D-tagatose/L-ribulose 3-epimerase